LSEYNRGWNELLSTGHSAFVSRNGTPKYAQLLMNTVVSLDGMVPFITIESKDLPEAEDFEKFKKMDTHTKLMSRSTIPNIDIRNYIECDRFIYFNYWKGRALLSVFYEIKTSSTQFAHFSNDLVYKKPRRVMEFRCSDAQGTYEVIRPEFMFSFLEDIANNNLTDNLDKRDQLFALTEDSNPVIFYYEYKDK
jgi:hypothetical protein